MAHASPPPLPDLPPRPRLVLRAGFAGSKDLSDADRNRLAPTLGAVLQTLGDELARLTPGEPVEDGQESRISTFFSRQRPLLRLVTGLCEGADALAGEVLQRVQIALDTGGSAGRRFATELAAVLPFDVETYRCSRPAPFHPEFDRQLARCAWVLTLDGKYDKPDDGTLKALPEDERRQIATLAKNRRGRAYRAQAAFLLRHADLLIAVAHADEVGSTGGTMETVRAALAFDLPVVFVHTGTGKVYPIAPEDEVHTVLAAAASTDEEWQKQLRKWVRFITAAPDSSLPFDEDDKSREQADDTLADFFNRFGRPTWQAATWTARFRASAWKAFEDRFRPNIKLERDEPLKPFASYRARATELNTHYSGQYRGAFLVNYAFAIVAVLLAALSLTLFVTAERESEGHGLPHWLLATLLALGLAKLGILIFIVHNTRRANREHWNDRAIDFRYLAERLRGMFYLPLAGSHQPPASAPPQFASRVVRQSAVDWLFDALVRAISPADLEQAEATTVQAHDGVGMITIQKHLTVDPANVVMKVRDKWIEQQARYHERNSDMMSAMHLFIEQAARFLAWAVIAVVSVDLVLLAGEHFEKWPHGFALFAQAATPWLIFTSAVLPAIVAALGGVRFQSECQRLAERSAVMRVLLKGRLKQKAGAPKGRWDDADLLARRNR